MHKDVAYLYRGAYAQGLLDGKFKQPKAGKGDDKVNSKLIGMLCSSMKINNKANTTSSCSSRPIRQYIRPNLWHLKEWTTMKNDSMNLW